MIQQNNLFYYQLGKKNRVVCVLGTVLLTDPLLRSCDAKIESLMPVFQQNLTITFTVKLQWWSVS